jgi:hypothetical protein
MGIWRSDIGLWVAYYITTRNNIQWTDLENIVMQHTNSPECLLVLIIKTKE